MPIYEYECEKCSCRFELLGKAGENGEVTCPKCQGRAHRLFSSVPVIFRGTRWVAEDKGKKELKKFGFHQPEPSDKPEGKPQA
jgi:putative FmdB family regulatory protein